jgi:hypothetical protein
VLADGAAGRVSEADDEHTWVVSDWVLSGRIGPVRVSESVARSVVVTGRGMPGRRAGSRLTKAAGPGAVNERLRGAFERPMPLGRSFWASSGSWLSLLLMTVSWSKPVATTLSSSSFAPPTCSACAATFTVRSRREKEGEAHGSLIGRSATVESRLLCTECVRAMVADAEASRATCGVDAARSLFSRAEI